MLSGSVAGQLEFN